MSDSPVVGSIVWQDLTILDAVAARKFYCDLVGWTAGEHPMGDYSDYEIKDASGRVVAGICHARGGNANVPPQWLIYIAVEDVAAAARRCIELGGRVLDGPRAMGGKQFCVIQDPAGAVAGLIG